MESGFRPLTVEERAILGRLLDEPFLGRDEAEAQVATCLVRRIDEDHCGSLEFLVQSEVLIPDSRDYDTPFPVEGRAMDVDGIPVEVLLFHRNGLLRELEFVVFSDRMKRMPRADEIQISRR